MRCLTCGDEYRDDELHGINDDGDRVCLRCIFLFLLYAKYEIPKVFTANSLMLDRISARFRKIIKNEYDLDPLGTFEKYFADKMQQIRNSRMKVQLPSDEFTKIENGWPFVFLERKFANALKLQKGEVLTVTCEGRPEKVISRPIYAIQPMKGKFARKYGKNFDVTVCFIPEDDNPPQGVE